MSSDILARVHAFTAKAEELGDKGYLLRAAENYGRASEAARALGVDNLVALFMQLRHSSMLSIYTTTATTANGSAEPRVLAAHRAECIALLSDALEALERRRVADTLLDGKCDAVEEAWRATQIQRANSGEWTVAEATSMAALVGYEQFLRAAKIAVDVLVYARLFAAECCVAQLHSFSQHVVHAAELLMQPRRNMHVIMPIEALFTESLRNAVAWAGARGLDARLVKLLQGAWERMQRSGVLEARCIEECIALDVQKQQALRAAIDSSLTAPGLRTCALPGCGAKEAHPAHFKSCAACRVVVYCCREHQVEGWPGHKKACKAAGKAAAAADDGAGPSGA